MRRLFIAATIAGAFASHSAYGQVSPSSTELGRVLLTQRVLADGKPLSPGTYQVRLTADTPPPVVGQSPNGERWVELVRNGQAAARELAIVVPQDEGGGVLKGPIPLPNQSRVDVLKGRKYLRLWFNKAGIHYIVNLPLAS